MFTNPFILTHFKGCSNEKLKQMKRITNVFLWDYLLLAARCLLAWTLASYGWAKLTDQQFGVDARTMTLPLKDVDLFRLSWYLADHEPFKSFVGLSQLGAAFLLSINRTALVGAFVSIPIWLNILVWDLTFMNGLTVAFTFRLSFYLVLTLLIIWRHKAVVVPALFRLTQPEPTHSYTSWAYLALPMAAIGLELLGAVPNALLYLFRLGIR